MKKLILIAAALLLSACGGSSDDKGSGAPPPILTPPVPGPVTDAFYQRLDMIVTQMPDNSEPYDSSNEPITEPETTEPTGS
jgi:hypothetical protein